jgi:Flp pilus assembly protein TadG
MQIRRSFSRRNKRKAAVVVETAVVLPLLLTILFGIIEFGWTFMIYQSIVNAAREGCRVAVLEGSTDSEINSRVKQYMDMVGIDTYSVSLTHASSTDPTETIAVKVPYSSVSLLGGYFGPTSFDLTGKASMRKEGSE